MLDLIALFQALLHLMLDVGRVSKRKLAQPMLTAACLTGAYTAIHIGQERSLSIGIRSAFLDNDTVRLERKRTEDETTLQAELRQFAAANKIIDQLLENIMHRAPGATRTRLSVIHNGVTGMTGAGLLRYDDTNSVAAPGRVPGMGVTNQPLSEWSDFLPTLLAGKCSFHHVAELNDNSQRARLVSIGATSVLVCPAADVQGRTLGALFILWDGNEPGFDADELRALMQLGQQFGAQAAAILDLRGPQPVVPVLSAN
jgi:hypothetical protein